MTTDRINVEIWNWATLNFPKETRESITLGIAEEAGELCRAVLKQYQGIRGSYEEWDAEIKKEIGDIYIKLGQLAGFCGWDLNDLIGDRWNEISKRDWIKNPTGHGLPSVKCQKCIGTVMVEKDLYTEHLRIVHNYYDYETEGLGGT